MSVFIESNSGLFIAFGIVLGSHGGRRGRRAVLAPPPRRCLRLRIGLRYGRLPPPLGHH